VILAVRRYDASRSLKDCGYGEVANRSLAGLFDIGAGSGRTGFDSF
jgi:hypothetical protein